MTMPDWVAGLDHAGLVIEGLIINGRGPIANGYLPLQRGVTVLYGLNGAGKSTVLDTLSTVFAGHVPDAGTAALLVRLDEPGNHSGLASGLLSWMDMPFYADFGETYLAGLSETLDQELTRGDDVAEEFTSQRRFVIRSLGHAQGVGWHPQPAVVLDETTPLLADLARILSNVTLLADGADLEALRLALGEYQAMEAVDDDDLVESAQRMLEGFPVESVFPIQSLSDLGSGLPPILSCRVYSGFDSPFLPDLVTESVSVEALNRELRARISQPFTRHSGAARATPSPIIDEDTPAASLLEVCDSMSRRATTELRRFLPTELTLEARVHAPRDWLAKDAVEWVACAQGGAVLPLNALSRAELRWAKVAIASLAENNYVLRALFPTEALQVWVFDEPEAALHRAAEAHMARGILEQAQSNRVTIVATHSPELLDSSANVVLVKPRPAGHNSLVPWSHHQLDDLESLGIRRSEMLGRYRYMLAVEGPHDRWIIDELLREELERVHACIVPMYGGKETPGLGTAGVLHEFTDWVMIPVWDNLRATLLASTWAELEIIVAAGGDDAAIASLLDAHLKGLGSEGKFARQFMRLAATSGQLHRFASPYALSRKDVLHYLPPRSLSQRMPATWGDVDVARAANGEASEKVFICTRYGLDLLEPEVRRAAASMDSVPGDLLGLISMLQQLEDERRS